DWQPWEPEPRLGIQVEIDATAAGFTQTPCYFAWLEGLAAAVIGRLATLPLEHLEVESPRGFRFCLVLPLAMISSPRDLAAVAPENGLLNLARARHLAVCWLGVEANGSRHPLPQRTPHA